MSSAAPAFAAASDPLQITGAWGFWTRNAPPTSDYMTANLSVNNNSTTDATNGLQLTLIFPNLYVYGASTPGGSNTNQALTFSNITSGWGAPVRTYTGSGTNRKATVVFTPSVQIPIGGSLALTFRAITTTNVTIGISIGTTDTITPITATAKAANGSDFVPGVGSLNPFI